MLSGRTTAGRLGCPICIEWSKAFTTLNFHKVCYFDCHRQFLPLNQAYRRNKKSFKKGWVETSPPPPCLSSLDVWNKVAHLPLCLESQEEKDFPSYAVEHNWKKQSIYWLLPYWKTQLLCLMSCTQREMCLWMSLTLWWTSMANVRIHTMLE